MVRILFMVILLIVVLVVCLLPLCLCWGMAALQRSSPCWFITWRVLGGLVSLAIVLALCYGFLWGPDRLVTTSYTYAHSEVPQGFDGYRIVQISDWHVGTFARHRERVERVVDRVNALQPDLIVFTGDLVNHSASEAEDFEEVLCRLSARDGIVSVMGNHDYMMYNRDFTLRERREQVLRLQQLQRRMGWKLLLNETYTLHRDGDSIVIAGIESNGNGLEVPNYRSFLRQTYDGVSSETCNILLSHYPSYWRSHVLPLSPATLQLSGHTHAMQLQLCGWSPSSWFYDEWYGLYEMHPHEVSATNAISGATGRGSSRRSLIVSRGVGGVGMAFRLGAWAEIVEITLKRV